MAHAGHLGSPASWALTCVLCTGEDLRISGLASLKLLQHYRPQRDSQPIAFISLPLTQPACTGAKRYSPSPHGLVAALTRGLMIEMRSLCSAGS